MAHYVIGDVQGCYSELQALVKKIKFNPNKDKIIFAGDLVNRGHQSLEVMDFCMRHKGSIKAVLGNHDFYLLYLIEHQKKNKSLKKVLDSKNIQKYHSWLKKLPLLLEIKIKETKETFWISHAGIPYIWDIRMAKKLSKEIQTGMKDDSFKILENIWGDTPKIWNSDLKGYKRSRTIINYFTRMRFLGKDGSLKLKAKKNKADEIHVPWFNQTIKNLKENQYIIFGHWAALEGKTKLTNIIGVDTGCVWGNKLTAIRLEDRKLFQVKKA
ncbi:symmetrical bis(5'-nucleosyl)-tetraphosphatase [Gammaproteobacteria bacterium]|nr:symmetrical bis(5'-nucleosyl)-tetraphosphatase [Gammaproteobacteria bacterium]MDA8899431.1 symmetrical bis(5'-nucleosyl)-tetraphosphatase [Gammaproteobacteria bacterium]MDA8916197.1 symmetrical bis(5'-nucleosyl)-tetraphosphatase [Gammaproteobacteria bacterium]MDA9045726.1 symmetrical bis(5'-nucleosyl)-tetraphosphatase [Gammaproteobacteria bacterium]MDB4835760.1 symmetrical bis(5'-nucleosyl)-tetraphosphatase [Gammaproteobacteria bacterium]|tara:strand:+ start:10379 stop:11185 length:807 start_codon:yes stop_codon:yes gene_type:complete